MRVAWKAGGDVVGMTRVSKFKVDFGANTGRTAGDKI